MGELDTEVFGISVDSFASHKRFREELRLPFDLLSDWDREVSKRYGVFNFREKVPNRVSFIIDKKGIVRFKQSSSISNPRDFESVIKKLKEIQSE